MKNFNVFDWLTFAVLAIGGLNWGLISAFNYDLVSTVFGDMTVITRVIYGLVGASALYMIFSALMTSENVYESTPKSRVVLP